MKRVKNMLLVMILTIVMSTPDQVMAEGRNYVKTEKESLQEKIVNCIKNGDKDFYVIDKSKTSSSSINRETKVHVWITKKSVQNRMLSRSSGEVTVVNWTLAGRYFYPSDYSTVSNYGMYGSADCTGTSVENVVWDAYHTVIEAEKDKYRATVTRSNSEETNGKKMLGIFRLKSKISEYKDDAELWITVHNDGTSEYGGNYNTAHVD